MANIRETYDAAKDAVYQFIIAKPERAFLSTWVDWWDHRRAFIFRAFSPSTEAPNMNLAEVIQASWAHCDRANLSLLDAAQANTRDSVLLEEELKAFEKGNVKGGVGPSNMGRRERTLKKEVLRAAQIGKEISKLRGNLVDPSSGHRPPLAKTGNKKKRATPQFRLPPSHVSHTPTQLSILSPKNHTATRLVILSLYHTVTTSQQVILSPSHAVTQLVILSSFHTVTHQVTLSPYHTVTPQVIPSPYHTVTPQVILSPCRTTTQILSHNTLLCGIQVYHRSLTS